MASLSAPLERALVEPDDLPALAVALQSLFDSRFHAEVETVGLGFDWNGRGYGSLGVEGMEYSSVAWVALSTAHDTVLQAMGEDGEHPGALATATCKASAVANGWRLSLVSADGTELGAAVWITDASE